MGSDLKIDHQESEHYKLIHVRGKLDEVENCKSFLGIKLNPGVGPMNVLAKILETTVFTILFEFLM